VGKLAGKKGGKGFSLKDKERKKKSTKDRGGGEGWVKRGTREKKGWKKKVSD